MKTRARINIAEVVKPVYEETVVLEMSKRDAAHILYYLGGIERGERCNEVYLALRNLLDTNHYRPNSGLAIRVELPVKCSAWITSLEIE